MTGERFDLIKIITTVDEGNHTKVMWTTHNGKRYVKLTIGMLWSLIKTFTWDNTLFYVQRRVFPLFSI